MTSAQSRLSAALSDRYHIDRELGQGGMATVYLAEDLKHGRKVAIKVLHPELGAVLGAERFLAEIKVTANLQHPHILGLIDSGDASGLLYYVMPFVEGESLRDRLTREQQLPVEDALRIAREVASALDYAHRHGVVHRDIKPENILLHDGSALVADFGIAIAVSAAGGSRLTQTGLSLGTPSYMSPEQAMGDRHISARADIYALGAVTYEMLTGEPPFSGATVQAIIARVMTEEPRAIVPQRKSVPPGVEAAVFGALQKLPADRWGTAKEFADALDSKVGSHAATVATRLPAHPPGFLPAHASALLAVITALSLLAAGWGWLRAGARAAGSGAPASWLAILTPNVGAGIGRLNRQLTLTPDGRSVIYSVMGADGVDRLVRQPLDAPEPIAISGSEGMSNPRVSPDGRSLIGFRASDSRSARVPLLGGRPVQLTTPRLAGNADWEGPDLVWFNPDGPSITRLLPGDSLRVQPAEFVRRLELKQLLDGGRTALAVSRSQGSQSGSLVLVDMHSGATRTLLETPVVEARYAAGLLVAATPDGSLRATAFDERRGQLTGTAVTLMSGVALTGTGYAQFDLSANGTLAYIPEEPRSIALVDRQGGSRPALPQHHNFHAPVFSPDGRRISMDFNTADGRDVWILSLDDGTLSRATFDCDGHDATWSPDGRTIVYSSVRSNVLGTHRARPGNAESAESLFASRELGYSGIWTPDGSALVTVAQEQRPGSGSDIVLLPNGGRGPMVPLLASQFQEQYPALSPDGRWLAFVSNQSGEAQVYVRPFGREGDQVQVSQAGGVEPAWGHDGRELLFRGGEAPSRLEVATVRTEPAFTVTARRSLFDLADYVGTAPHANYSISPDGKTFAMVRRNPATRIMVIQNLPEIVRRMRGAEEGGR